MKKISTLTGIIIIVIVGIVLVGGAFVYQQFIVSQWGNVFAPEEQPSRIVGWKTYTNNEYGFEIQYPSMWVSEESQRLYDVRSATDNLYAISFCSPRPGALTNCNGNSEQISLFLFHEKIKNENSRDSMSIYLGFNQGNYYYLFNTSSGNQDIFNKMLSTFKFTK